MKKKFYVLMEVTVNVTPKTTESFIAKQVKNAVEGKFSSGEVRKISVLNKDEESQD